MKKLQYYADLLKNGEICYKGTKKQVIVNDCSVRGLALEIAIKDYHGQKMEISGQKQLDLIFTINGKKHFAEIKSNSSPIDVTFNKNSVIFYAFGIQLDKPLNQQYAYIVPKKDFLSIGYELKHIKEGTTSNGRIKCYKTQTVWNNSKQAPHGSKCFKLEDRYIQAGAIPFSEYFKETV